MTTLAALCLVVASAVAPPAGAKYENRPLADVLRELQSGGLRIVFSSEIVTPNMRVLAEPRATLPRQILDEVLKPHRLKAEDGPGGVIQVIRAKPVKAPDNSRPPANKKARAIDDDVTRAAGGYTERVTVTARPGRRDGGVGVDLALDRAGIQDLRDGLADDPMRAVQALPHVAAGDDFRSEFSVRGSPYRHVGVVVDGVPAPWLQHTVYGAGATGSLGMLNSMVVEQATLQAGAYPRRYGDWLGPQLDLTLREGSRVANQFRGAVGGTSATVMGEGPLGASAGGARGSWLVAVRQSYREWPSKLRGELSGKPFGFADAQAKLVYDARAGQQVSLTFLGGRSRVDERGSGAPDTLALATNEASVASLGWRSTFNPSLVLRQRLSLATHAFADTTQSGRDSGRGRDGEIAYHADVTRSLLGAVVEAGVDASRVRASRFLKPIDAFDGVSRERAGYVNATWRPTSHLTIAPGVRVGSSSLVRGRAVSRWVLGEWAARDGWTVNASAGVFQSLPRIAQALGGAGAPDIKPERETLFDVGVGQHIGASLRWQATLFRRTERDILREPDGNPRLVNGALTDLSMPGRYENALRGSSRGVEVLLEQQRAARFSGWIAYSYGRTRLTDAARGETFWADFDQRHGVNASGFYRLSDRTRVSVKFRGGTNFPIPGYLAARDGGLVAGARRNMLRLPAYARFDVRASRTFDYPGRRITIFAEVLNVLNRRNLGIADGFIRPATGEAAGFTRTLFPRVPSAGILIEF
jgi:hypothetical protein